MNDKVNDSGKFIRPKNLRKVRFVAVLPGEYNSSNHDDITAVGLKGAEHVGGLILLETTGRDVVQIVTLSAPYFLVSAGVIASKSECHFYNNKPYISIPSEIGSKLLDVDDAPQTFLHNIIPTSIPTNYMVFVGSEAICRVLSKKLCEMIGGVDKDSAFFAKLDCTWKIIDVDMSTGQVTFTPYG